MIVTATVGSSSASATPSSRAVRARHLPGPTVSSSRLPRAETAAFVVVLPLLSIPVLLATMGAAWAAAAGVGLTAVVTWLCLARHAVVGRGWIADRRLFRYRVTEGNDLRVVEFLPNGHGGLIRLHPDTGRAHRLRAPEFTDPALRAALADVVAGSDAVVSVDARAALGLDDRHLAIAGTATGR